MPWYNILDLASTGNKFNDKRGFFDWTIPTPHSVALSWHSFAWYLFPPLACYYATAVLVQLPNTLWHRLALMPLTLYLAYRAGTQVDLSVGHDTLTYLNQGLALAYATVGLRAIIWAFQTHPFMRIRSTSALQSKTLKTGKPAGPNTLQAINGRMVELNHRQDIDLAVLLLDAWDLFANLRGVGWNWSRGLYIVPEHRTTTSRAAFLTEVLKHFLSALIIFDFLQYSVQSFAPLTVGSTNGGSIFDPTLDPVQRYCRSLIMTLLAGFAVYAVIQCGYALFTLIGVGIFRQEPSLYPPIFSKPWVATSLREFWSRRWHQAFRDGFINMGAKPVSRLFGRTWGVLGAFLVSGLFHNIGVWGMGRGSDFVPVGGFFLMNGVGVLLEQVWPKATGYKVGGLTGWVWSMAWLIFWGQFLLDAWAKTGLIGSTFIQHDLRPSIRLFGPLV